MQSNIEEIGQELHIVPSTGCLSRLGLVLGLGIIVIAFVPVQQRGGAEWYTVLPVGVGIFVLSSYRRRIIIDRDEEHIFRRTKLLGYTKQTRGVPLARFSHVALGHQWRKTENSRRRVFFVSLSGDEPFSIGEHSQIDASRDLAEGLALRLSLPIHDSSFGGVSVTAVSDIGICLKQRLQNKDDDHTAISESATPADQTVQVEKDSNTLCLTVTQPGFSLSNFAKFLPMMAFGFFIIWIVKIGFEPNRDFGERVIAVSGTLFACAWILWPVCFYMSHATRNVYIKLSKSELQFEAKTIFRTRNFAVDVEDLVDVFAFDLNKLGYRKGEAIGVTGGVAIRTRDKTLRFGAHLPQDEQLYLRDLLRSWISQM